MRVFTKKRTNRGGKRSVFKFAWLPQWTDEGYVVWLEHYWAHQTFRPTGNRDLQTGESRGYWDTYKLEVSE